MLGIADNGDAGGGNPPDFGTRFLAIMERATKRHDMARGPTPDTRSLAEKAFKAATTKPADLPPSTPSLPGAKETVSLRIDRDVLDFFQQDGPGWQDRINAALRKAAGK